MLKYYVRLGLHKNSTGSNVWDGIEGRSYAWFVYARLINENLVLIARNANGSAYSPTTSKHIGELSSHLGYPRNVDCYAPKGLSTPEPRKHLVARRDTLQAKVKLSLKDTRELELINNSLRYLYGT